MSPFTLNVSSVFVLSLGFLMLLMTILSVVHLMSQCLLTERSSSRGLEPHVTYVETVSQPESIRKNKL